ncbi:MAG: VWA domain-containing protein [Bacteroidales bacterium]|nr:VWA domain-containing protein [Bacteroidales bacterium]
MKYSRLFIFISTVISLLYTLSVFGQERLKYEPPDTRILFIFDASQSMLGNWQKSKKIDVAKEVLINIIDSLEQLSNVKMALRLYGHQSPVPPQDCNDTRLEVPFGTNTAPKIRQKLRYITPMGTTPIANSLALGAKDFPDDCDNCRNIIILITDGIEACDGDPCAVSYDLQKQGIVLKPFVIGVGIDEDFAKSFDCIGHYYNAVDEEKFKEVMEVVISQALNATTAQVNLLDVEGNPTETNVNLTFYDHFSGRIVYNYIHTMNNRGKPDTLVLDHLITYDMKVHTIPPVKVDSIKLSVGKHTVIAADVPQGTLSVVSRDNQYRDVQYLVRKAGDMNTLNVQKFYDEEKYLIGKYDLEIPVLPRVYVYDVEIKQNYATKIEVPRPGILTLVKATNGYGSIYLRKSNKEEEWIYNLNPNSKIESITIQPGKYRIVFRAQNARQTLYTISKTVEIKSGSSEAVQLY